MEKLVYNLVKTMPAAQFYYKGTHSHPVRRTILIIEETSSYLRGYELREGKKVRNLRNAPVKSYAKAKIAMESQLGANKHRIPGPKVTTLKRMTLLTLVKIGI